jgi:carbon storage regulator
MLILTRKPGEILWIETAGGIKLTVVSVGGQQVRLGIDADINVNIVREELRKKDKNVMIRNHSIKRKYPLIKFCKI